MSTLKDIIAKMKEIALSTGFYKTAWNGWVGDLNANQNEYPLVWIDQLANSTAITTSSVYFTFDVFFCDLLYHDKSNELDIHSDTMETAIDFVRVFKENYAILKFDTSDVNYTATVFSEKWNDNLAGTKLTITITRPGSGSQCKNTFKVV